MKITESGIYRDVSEVDYRADPCPVPSLTQSLIKIALERSMRSVYTASPSLNPAFAADDDAKFDVGNVAHHLVLGRGKDYGPLDFEDWRTKAAKEQRAELAKAGRIGILKDQHARAIVMASECRRLLDRHEDRDAFTNGTGEVMIAWEEDGIWCRALIDWLHDDLRTVDDYKSTDMSVAPHLIGIRAEAGGWDIQAAFIERGLDTIDPAGAGRRRYRFIAQEASPPHDLTVMHMSEHWLTMGRKKVEAGIGKWRQAFDTGRWPTYPLRSITPEYPGFRENRWLERETSGEFENNDPSLIFAG